jgi:peptidoglycan/xylan/chitin deacetylase (PgdA/CDA1 family)
MPVSITASVGERGENRPDDVRQIFLLLNKKRTQPLVVSDQCSIELIQAIKEFQKDFLTNPDGRIDVGGRTWKELTASNEVQGNEKKVLLSFDDGPLPEDALNSILATLQSHHIKAEFYVLGAEVDRHPKAAKKIADQGHSLQNHSYSHIDLSKASKEVVMTELRKTQESIKNAAGVTATKVRPPYGAGGWPAHHDPELAQVGASLSLKIENWDIDTEDWKGPKGIGSDKLTMIKKQFTQQQSKLLLNVLMHVQSETARDLDSFIAQLKRWGYSFAKP